MYLLLAVGGLLLLFVGTLWTVTNPGNGIAAIGVGVLLFILAWYADKCRVTAKRNAYEAKVRERINGIAQKIEPRQRFELQIRASSGIGMFVLVSMGAAFSVWMGVMSAHLGWMVGGIVVGVPSLFFVFALLPTLGKPSMVLRDTGFQIADSPVIPWAMVAGVHLQKLVHRGHLVSQILHIRVPAIERLLPQFPWYLRVLAKVRMAFGSKEVKGRLLVMLKGSKPEPEVVEEITRRLWACHGGVSHSWNPEMPDSYNRALRQVAEDVQVLQNGGKFDAQTQGEALRRISENARTIEREAKKRLRWFQWLNFVAIGAVLLGLAFRYFK